MARASRATSSIITSDAILTPPMAGPQATLSTDDDRFETHARLADGRDLLRPELGAELGPDSVMSRLRRGAVS